VLIEWDKSTLSRFIKWLLGIVLKRRLFLCNTKKADLAKIILDNDGMAQATMNRESLLKILK
jgi:hypothetical protein